MRHRTILSIGAALASAALMAAACGKDGDKRAKPSDQTATSADKKTAGSHPFAGASLALPEELAALRWDASVEENQKLLGADSTRIDSKAHDGVVYVLRSNNKDKVLTAVEIVTELELEPILTKAWGAPVKDKDGVAYWFNADSGLRGHISKYGDGKELDIDRYQSLEKHLGKKGFAFAFAEGKALLGSSIEGLKPVWGEKLCDYEEKAQKLLDAYKARAEDSLNSLPDAYSRKLDLCWGLPRGMESYSRPDALIIGKDGKVASYGISVDTGGSAELVARTVAILDNKLGEAVLLDHEKRVERYYFEPELRLRVVVTVWKDNKQVSIKYSPYLPLDELFGGDGPGLGIETEGTLGTFESAQKSDPEHFQQAGVLASLIYPPTDFAQNQTEIDLNRYAKAKKVHEYRVVLHYGENPELEARILALLEKKFGAPTPSKRKAQKGKYIDYKGKRKVQVWQVSNQFQITVAK